LGFWLKQCSVWFDKLDKAYRTFCRSCWPLPNISTLNMLKRTLFCNQINCLFNLRLIVKRHNKCNIWVQQMHLAQKKNELWPMWRVGKNGNTRPNKGLIVSNVQLIFHNSLKMNIIQELSIDWYPYPCVNINSTHKHQIINVFIFLSYKYHQLLYLL
jgi:hypothetical protein